MRAKDLMTATPKSIGVDESIEGAAKAMAECDCGAVPVLGASGDLVGIITDRDITLRAVARGKPGSTPVREIMTSSVATCSTDAAVDDVVKTMSDRQVRRVVIVDDDRSCVGIISQADIALAIDNRGDVQPGDVAKVVERISEPRV